MLAGAGLGDDARLAHPQREQRLAERVVDLVGAGVIEVFALEVDVRAAAFFGQPLRSTAATAGRRSSAAGPPARSETPDRAGPRRTPPPARPGRASAFRAHTARRTRRIGRRRRGRAKWRCGCCHTPARSSSGSRNLSLRKGTRRIRFAHSPWQPSVKRELPILDRQHEVVKGVARPTAS